MTKETEIRAALYARTSTGDEGGSIPDQLASCKAFASERGWPVVDKFPDNGVTGTTIKRPELLRLLSQAEKGLFDVVIVLRPDRLARSLDVDGAIRYRLQSAEVKIVYVDGPAPDDDSPMARAMAGFSAVMAELDREMIVARTQGGMRRSIERGNVLVRSRPPLGYKLDPEELKLGNHRLVRDDDQAKTVEEIFRLYTEEQLGVGKIADRLNLMGYPTWAQVHQEKINLETKHPGWMWWSVANVLGNKTYSGEWTYRAQGGELTVEVPAIIDPEIWNMAQEQKKVNAQRSRRNKKKDYLLSGHIRCKTCGYAMRARSPRPGVIYYFCDSHLPSRYDTDCDTGYLRGDGPDGLEAVVWDYLERRVLSEKGFRKLVREAVESGSDRARTQNELAQVNDQIERVKGDLNWAEEVYYRSRNLANYERRTAELQEQLTALERLRDGLQEQLASSGPSPKELEAHLTRVGRRIKKTYITQGEDSKVIQEYEDPATQLATDLALEQLARAQSFKKKRTILDLLSVTILTRRTGEHDHELDIRLTLPESGSVSIALINSPGSPGGPSSS